MASDEKRILILGHGAMGRMFEALLRDKAPLAIWDRDLDSGEETLPLETAARDAGVIVFALPTQPHDELAARLAPCLSSDSLCLSIAKGLDAEGRSPAELFARHFGERPGQGPDWALIYGPMIARDLNEGRAGFAVAAGRDLACGQRTVALFEGSRLHLRPGDDPRGAAWAAILKNVYVPLIGMAEGLGLGDNMRGFLLCEALAELARIVERMGGRRETAYDLAGLGDLITTATSPSSHHRSLGEALARGDQSVRMDRGANLRSEGLNTAAMVSRHGLFEPTDYPLFALVLALLDRPEAIEDRLQAYIRTRFSGDEAPVGTPA